MLLPVSFFYLGIIFIILSIIAAFVVILAKHPITSIIALAFVFMNVAGLLLILDAEFVGLMYVVVYVGAIIVLFLYITMLLNMKILVVSESLSKMSPAVFIVVALWVYLMIESIGLPAVSDVVVNIKGFTTWTSASVRHIDNIVATQDLSNTELLGILLYNYYYVHFVMIGVILTAALISAISLVIHSSERAKKQLLYQQLATLNQLKIIARNQSYASVG